MTVFVLHVGWGGDHHNYTVKQYYYYDYDKYYRKHQKVVARNQGRPRRQHYVVG
jgi:hypothetical protein